MPHDSPQALHDISRFWAMPPAEKVRILEENMDDDMANRIRGTFQDAAFTARNQEIWQWCKSKGVTTTDIADYFGGDEDHIRRALKNGRPSARIDQWLTIGLIAAGAKPKDWLIAPTAPQQLLGLRDAVTAYRHLCVTTSRPIVPIAEPGEAAIRFSAAQAREPGLLMTVAETAFLRALMDDSETLNTWIHLTAMFALEGSDGRPSQAYASFIKNVVSDAMRYLADSDVSNRSLFQTWMTDANGPVACLAAISKAWNTMQLYFHIVAEEIRI